MELSDVSLQPGGNVLKLPTFLNCFPSPACTLLFTHARPQQGPAENYDAQSSSFMQTMAAQEDIWLYNNGKNVLAMYLFI